MTPDVEAAALKVEEAFTGRQCEGKRSRIIEDVKAWLAARRAARDAGLVSVMVSRESLETLRAAQGNGDTVRACNYLARDLAPYLKEPK